MVPRCQKCNADRRKVIIVRNGVGHVTDLELDVSGALSLCPSGDPAQQVQSSYPATELTESLIRLVCGFCLEFKLVVFGLIRDD